MSYYEYLYSAGAIKEAEMKLVSEGDVERMIDAPNIAESFKVFNDLSYVDELLETSDPERFPSVLSHDLKQVKNFISSISPDETVLKGMYAEDDFANIRMLFKDKLKGKTDAGDLSHLGFLDSEKLKNFIMDGKDAVLLPKAYEEIIEKAYEEILDTTSAQEIDSYFEKRYYEFVLDIAKELNDGLIKDIVTTRIDTTNIKIILRSHLLFHKPEEMIYSLVEGGSLDLNKLTEWIKLDETDIVEKLSHYINDSRTVTELRRWVMLAELWELDKILDEHLARVMRGVNYIEAGPAVLWVYYMNKKRAIKNISIIMTGKINNINEDNIKHRIRSNSF